MLMKYIKDNKQINKQPLMHNKKTHIQTKRHTKTKRQFITKTNTKYTKHPMRHQTKHQTASAYRPRHKINQTRHPHYHNPYYTFFINAKYKWYPKYKLQPKQCLQHKHKTALAYRPRHKTKN